MDVNYWVFWSTISRSFLLRYLHEPWNELRHENNKLICGILFILILFQYCI